jgi:hypothetical protein
MLSALSTEYPLAKDRQYVEGDMYFVAGGS